MAVPSTEEKYYSTTIQRVFDILELFKRHQKLSFTEIKERLGYNKSTLFRALYMLEKNKYLTKDKNGRYELGMNIFILGTRFSMENQLKKVSNPYMRELSERVDLTVQLGILEGLNVVILNKVDPPNSIKMYSRIGAMVPAHCTGQGKTLLAFSPEDQVRKIVNYHGLKRYTPHTITNLNDLMEELKLIRQRGYTIDNSEHENHIKCVAVPVLNEQGLAVAALSITGLVMDFEGEGTVNRYARLLHNVADNIERDLGFIND